MKSLTTVFKLLSDSTRLRIIVLLYHTELCVCELAGILKISQPSISKNLAKLRDLQIVVDNRQKKFVYYSLNSEQTFLMSVLESINNNLQVYPQLFADRKAVADRTKYSSVCKGQIM